MNGNEGGRNLAESLAVKHGLVLKSGVVKSLGLLVAADVCSMSTKAEKARQYGIPILSEEEYWQLLGMKAEPA